jgi:hypothetical protein
VIEPPRPNELFDPRHTDGRSGLVALAGTSLRATDESYDQLAAEAVAENEGMPAPGRGFGPRRTRHGPTVEHGEGALVLLLETFDRSLERLRATSHRPDRMLHRDLEIVRDRYAEQLAALRDG